MYGSPEGEADPARHVNPVVFTEISLIAVGE